MANQSQTMTKTQTEGIRVPVGHIVVNERWLGSALLSDLQALIPVHIENSTSAIDFHPSCNVGVVFLSESDIVEGNAYKRKVARLRKANKVKGIVLVEKSITSAQYFKGVQKFCISDLGLCLIPVGSQSEAAAFLVQMVYVEGKLDKNPFLRPRVSPRPDPAVFAAVTSCPGVGDMKAASLLESFPSLELLCRASQEELCAVVGKAIAKKLFNFLQD